MMLAAATAATGFLVPSSALPNARACLNIRPRVAHVSMILDGRNATAAVGRRPSVMLTARGVEIDVWSPLVNECIGLLLTLSLSLAPVVGSYLASQLVSAYAIPSRSMDETLKVGDVVLAEKVSTLLHLPLERGDLLFFEPPQELADIVADQGTRLGARDRFVKRVAAVAGDQVQLDESGRGVLVNGVARAPPTVACTAPPPSASARRAAAPPPVPPAVDREVQARLEQLLAEGRIDGNEASALLREVAPPPAERAEGAVAAVSAGSRARIFGNIEAKAVDPAQLGVSRVVPPDAVFVLGDCEARSTDSRVWGPLETRRVAARPFVRIWPPDRIGAIETSQDLNPFRRSALRFRLTLDEAIRRPF